VNSQAYTRSEPQPRNTCLCVVAVFPVAKWCRVHPGVTEAGVMEANVSWTTEECLSPLAFLCQVSLNDRITAQVSDDSIAVWSCRHQNDNSKHKIAWIRDKLNSESMNDTNRNRDPGPLGIRIILIGRELEDVSAGHLMSAWLDHGVFLCVPLNSAVRAPGVCARLTWGACCPTHSTLPGYAVACRARPPGDGHTPRASVHVGSSSSSSCHYYYYYYYYTHASETRIRYLDQIRPWTRISICCVHKDVSFPSPQLPTVRFRSLGDCRSMEEDKSVLQQHPQCHPHLELGEMTSLICSPIVNSSCWSTERPLLEATGAFSTYANLLQYNNLLVIFFPPPSIASMCPARHEKPSMWVSRYSGHRKVKTIRHGQIKGRARRRSLLVEDGVMSWCRLPWKRDSPSRCSSPSPRWTLGVSTWLLSFKKNNSTVIVLCRTIVKKY